MAQAWQRRGQHSECQLAVTLVLSSEADDKVTAMLCVPWCLQQYSHRRPAVELQYEATCYEVDTNSIK